MSNNTAKEYTERIKSLANNLNPMEGFQSDFKEMCLKSTTRIGTGWLSVDKALNGGLANELYIMGAETSTGKSALMMAMAQNIAASGVNVLYFSLEMAKEEFVARGISSISFKHSSTDKNAKRFTAGDVLYYSYDNTINDFVKIAYSSYEAYSDEYFNLYGKHLYIITSAEDGYSAKDVANIAYLFQEKHPDEKTVVFVDYMQILKADSSDRSQVDRKTKADLSTIILKTLASKGMPVITMSSISRNKYGDKISTKAFKESGDIEYTGGILIGWNWKGVTDCSDKKKIQAEQNACKARGYRKMTFDVLKYRNSERNNEVQLIYFPAYNYFLDQYDWDTVGIDNDDPFKTWDEEPVLDDDEDIANQHVL